MPSPPNFLFIGPDKAGSTWLYQALNAHPQVYLPKVKELFYFDRYYDRGWDWYLRYFTNIPPGRSILAEISHDYLFSTQACERMARDLPDVRLMACLREPVERAFSSYLYMIKQGRVQGSFEDAIERVAELVDHGLYTKHLTPYFAAFPRERIYLGVFDDLRTSSDRFFKDLCRFLGIEEIELPEALRDEVLPAARPRWFAAAKVARAAGWLLRSAGMPELVARAKNSPLLSRTLYKEYGKHDKPRINPETKVRLKEHFRSDVEQLERLTGLKLCERWGYA